MSEAICKNCQTVILDKAKFCIKCGELYQEDVAEEINITADSSDVNNGAETINNSSINTAGGINTAASTGIPKKKNKIFPPIVTAAVILAAVVTAFILFMPGGGALFGKSASSKYQLLQNHISAFDAYDLFDLNKVIFFPINNEHFEIEGRLEKYSESMDGTKAAALIIEYHEGDCSSWENCYTLYMITDKKKLISHGVQDFILASSGNAVLYAKELDTTERTAELWLYSEEDEKSIKIASDFELNNPNYDFIISPDGKTIAYMARENDRLTGFVWDGQIHELGRGLLPLAVSDEAKYIYYFNNNNLSLYVQKGVSGDEREKISDRGSRLYTNNDLSQIIYEYNNKAYLCINGSEKFQLNGTIKSFIFPDSIERSSTYYVTTYGVSGFEDTYYRNGDGALIKINSSYEAISIAKNTDDAYMSDSGDILTYLKNEQVYKVNTNDDSTGHELISDGKIRYYVATSDGEAIYFINNDWEICYKKNDEKPVVVAYDFTSLSEHYHNEFDYSDNIPLLNGNMLLYISDGELYVSDGGKGKLVGNINGEVDDVYMNRFHIYIEAYDYDDLLLYYSNDAKEFKLLMEDEEYGRYTPAAATTAPTTSAATTSATIASPATTTTAAETTAATTSAAPLTTAAAVTAAPLLTVHEAKALLQEWFDYRASSFYEIYIDDYLINDYSDDVERFTFVVYQTHELGWFNVDRSTGDLFWVEFGEGDISIDDWYNSSNYGAYQEGYPAEVVYNDYPVSGLFDLTLSSVRHSYGTPLSEGYAGSGHYLQYSDIIFYIDDDSEKVFEILAMKPGVFQYDGVNLDINRNELISLLGAPSAEDDQEPSELYYGYEMEYNLADYTVYFFLQDPYKNAEAILFMLKQRTAQTGATEEQIYLYGAYEVEVPYSAEWFLGGEIIYIYGDGTGKEKYGDAVYEFTWHIEETHDANKYVYFNYGNSNVDKYQMTSDFGDFTTFLYDENMNQIILTPYP